MNFKINDIYEIDAIDYLKQEENNKFDLIIVDPPYNILKNDWDYYQNDRDYFSFTENWLNLCFDKLKKDGSIYLFNTPQNNAVIYSMAIKRGFKFRNWITWNKKESFAFPKKKFVSSTESILFLTKGSNNHFDFDSIREGHDLDDVTLSMVKESKNDNFEFFNKKGKLIDDIWSFNTVGYNKKKSGEEMIHPSEKPEKLIERIIKASSKEGDLVLDLFSGSGTTSYVAKKNNRNFIGIEAKKEYIEIAKKKLD